MTRKTLETVAAMTDEKLAGYSVVETAAIEAHVRQANAADRRVEELANAHQEELAANNHGHQEELAAKDHGHAEVANSLRIRIKELEALVAALGGTEAGKRLAKEQRIAELKAYQARAAAELEALTKDTVVSTPDGTPKS